MTLQVQLRYIHGFGQVMFGLYNVAARILLLNMLIAMMAKSFNVIVVSGFSMQCIASLVISVFVYSECGERLLGWIIFVVEPSFSAACQFLCIHCDVYVTHRMR